MTKGQTYRLNCSVFTILSPPNGSRHPITIPENSFHVIGGPLNGNRLVEVKIASSWRSRAVEINLSESFDSFNVNEESFDAEPNIQEL